MTLKEIVWNVIKLSIGGGVPSDDIKLRQDQVAAWVNYYRARFLKDYYNKYKKIDQQYVQDLGCVELECVDKADCCQVEVEESYLKLKNPLPQLVDLREGGVFFQLSTVDKMEPITLSDPTRAFYRKHRRYGKNTITAFRISNQLYFDAPQGTWLKWVNIRTILSNPEDVTKFTNCSGEPLCEDFWEEEYPIPADLIQVVTQSIIERELNLVINTKRLDDEKNDAREVRQVTERS